MPDNYHNFLKNIIEFNNELDGYLLYWKFIPLQKNLIFFQIQNFVFSQMRHIHHLRKLVFSISSNL